MTHRDRHYGGEWTSYAYAYGSMVLLLHVNNLLYLMS